MKKKDLHFSTSRSTCIYSLLVRGSQVSNDYYVAASFSSASELVAFVNSLSVYTSQKPSMFVYNHSIRHSMSYYMFCVNHFLEY